MTGRIAVVERYLATKCKPLSPESGESRKMAEALRIIMPSPQRSRRCGEAGMPPDDIDVVFGEDLADMKISTSLRPRLGPLLRHL